MDAIHKAVHDAFSDDFTEDQKKKAKGCLASSCVADVSKCLSGPCNKKHFMKNIRTACFDAGKIEYAQSKSFCQFQCEARVKGVRGSTLALGIQDPVGSTPSDLVGENKEKFDICVMECQQQQATSSEAYKNCMEEKYIEFTKACVKENCLDKLRACQAKRCGTFTE